MLEATTLGQAIQEVENTDGGPTARVLRESLVPTSLGALTTTALATIRAVEYGPGDLFHRTELYCQGTPLSLSSGSNTVQIATLKAYTLPSGAINFLGGSIDGTLTLTGAGTVMGTTGLGTVATTNANAALTTTEQDLIQARALYITTGIAPLKSYSTSAPGVFDGTSTNVAAHLNVTLPELSTTATAATFTGKIGINWVNLGDI